MRVEDEPMSPSPYRLASDMRVRPEVIGLQSLLMPFVQNVSAQRGVMWASNSNQAMVTHGNEPPLVMTGWEPQIGEYEYDPTVRKQEIQILDVIPMPSGRINNGISVGIPSVFVLYQGLEDHKLNYFEVHDYTELGDGFGYYNKKMNSSALRVGNTVPKEMKFITSPNHDGEFYSMGMNLNVCYLSHWAANEDAFIISDELIDRGTVDAFETISIDLDVSDFPLNIFGDDAEYKILPDIGECVREDGLLMAFRPKNDATFLSDMLPSELQKVEELHDISYMAKPGARIVDIRVYINRDKFNNVVKQDITGKTAYGQLMKYRDLQMKYYQEVVESVNKFRLDYEMHSELNSLMRQFIGLVASNDPKRNFSTKLMNCKDVIEFIHIDVTYSYELKVALGSKWTGRLKQLIA